MSICQNCGKKLNAFTEKYGFIASSDERLCADCRTKITNVIGGNVLTDAFISANRSSLIANGVTENGLLHLQRAAQEHVDTAAKAAKAAEEQQKLEERVKKNKDGMLLSTCQSISGKKVVEEYGIVFGECLFKSGFLKRLDAAFDNLTDVLSFGDQELSGTSQLLDDARAYAVNKMMTKAAGLGANAIIGVDSESSAGGDIIHITIYGTAVRVEPIEQ